MHGEDKIRFFQEYVDNDFGFMFKKYGSEYNNKKHLDDFLDNRCKHFWLNRSLIEVDLPKTGKHESYWRNEDELTYHAPTFQELSYQEKSLYQKNLIASNN